MEERLLAEVATAWRYGRPVGFVLVDVDHFKAINDTLGHAAGDRALQTVAHLLRTSIRAGDTVGRFGGDEFALVVRETLADGMERFVERLANIVGEHSVDAGKGGARLSVSVGGALLSQVCASSPEAAVTALYEAADTAMYEAKRQGRGRGDPVHGGDGGPSGGGPPR